MDVVVSAGAFAVMDRYPARTRAIRLGLEPHPFHEVMGDRAPGRVVEFCNSQRVEFGGLHGQRTVPDVFVSGRDGHGALPILAAIDRCLLGTAVNPSHFDAEHEACFVERARKTIGNLDVHHRARARRREHLYARRRNRSLFDVFIAPSGAGEVSNQAGHP